MTCGANVGWRWKQDSVRHPGATLLSRSHLPTHEYYLRDDLLWSFLSLQKLGQGISKGFQHSHMGRLEAE